MTLAAVRSVPWYRSLNRTQWKALIASNLGWTFDGFEVFALILTIGAALHQLLDPSEYKYIPVLCRRGHCDNRLRLGGGRPARRHTGRLYRPQAVDDAYDPCLFAADWLERALLGLAVFCRASLSRWARDRLGMGDGRLDHGRALAGQGARQGWRVFAMRIPDRKHSCLRYLGDHRHVRSRRLALHVSDRRAAGADRVLDPAQHSRIAPVGGIEQAPSRRA